MKKNQTFTDPYYTYQIFFKSENFKKWHEENTISFKKYRENWEKRPAEQTPGEFPLNLNIEITTKCNLACTFCYHRELTKEQKIHMKFDLFKKIIDEAKKYKLPAVNLNGLGEPITHPQLVEMISYCRDSNIEDIMFHTNGTVMTEKLAKKLINAGLTQIIFSLDTTDKKIFEEMRVGANFEKVNNNVELFIKVRNQLGSKLPIVRTTMVLTDKTINQVKDFKKKWDKLSDSITAQDLVY
jgi:MoaA/NifB/PqqE/SkfB family radical SAM enzyme